MVKLIVEFITQSKADLWRSSLALLLASGLCLMSVCWAEESVESIEIAVAEWPPLITAETEGQGALTERVRSILAAEGVAMSLHFFESWSDVDTAISAEQRFSFDWVKNDERRERWLFSEALITLEQGFWVRADFPARIDTFEDLSHYLVGVSQNYSYGSAYEANKSLLRRAEFLKEGDGFKRLIEGRIDLLISAQPVGRHYSEKHALQHSQDRTNLIFMPSRLLGAHPLHFICGRNSPECPRLMALVNRAIKRAAAKQ